MQNTASGLYAAQSAPTSAPASKTNAGGQPPLSAGGLGAISGQHPQQQQQTGNHAVLPDRSVTATTIEDAYVSFILACNPAVSPSTDTTALREAFRTPPRSDGKSFSIFTLYELICQLEGRVIKTWAELALKLGVEPPDQDKRQSSQKIQQYAVRLKRWMHSMHVNAFFDYLMDRPHPYWTNIPTSLYPVSEHLRDGVAAKDDMALRALIPEIKPRRGRRRPDDDSDQDLLSNQSPSQRQRLDDYDDGRWSDGRNDFGFPHHLSPPDMGGLGQGGAAWSTGIDGMSTPLSAYPQSAITPSSRVNYWSDEPKSAVAGSSGQSARRPGRRHGAKVVSSAWRSSGTGGSGKTRGRPPINRNGNHHSSMPISSTQDSSFHPASVVDRTVATYPPASSSYGSVQEPTTSAPLSTMHIPDLTSVPTLTRIPSASTMPPIPVLTLPDNMSPPSSTASARSSRPGHLSLQVPSRQGADIRLASPPMRGVSDAMSSFMHSQTTPSSTAASEKSQPLTSYNSTSLDLPLAVDFVPDATSHHSQTPSLADTHSPAAATNVGSGTTCATSVTPEIAPNAIVDPDFGWINKRGEAPRSLPKATPRPPPVYSAHFGTGEPGNRTNIDKVEAYFMTEIFAAKWYDENDQRMESCSVEEASALVDIVIEDLTKGAPCKEAFLINLAALAGGKLLMADTDAKVKRLEHNAEYSRYDFSWELRFGDVFGRFNITETVEHARWKKMTNDVKASVARAVGLRTEAEERGPPKFSPVRSSGMSNSITTILEGGQMRFPMQSQNLNAAGRYEGLPPGMIPAVNPGIQNYPRHTDFTTSGINYGIPIGSQAGASGASGASGSGGATTMGTTTPGSGSSHVATAEENLMLAALWERKYRELLELVYKRDRQLDRTRHAVFKGLKETYDDEDGGSI